MKNILITFACVLISLYGHCQMNYLSKSSIEVRRLTANYNLESLRTDDGSKCLFYTDTETNLLFAMYFDDSDKCKLVIVTPNDKITELALFKMLDDKWTPINSKEWAGNSPVGRVTVKAMKDEKLGIHSFYYSL